MIPLYPQQLFQPSQKIINGDGTGANLFFYLVRALFNRTGGNRGLPNRVGDNLVASGSGQTDAFVLSDDFNDVTSGSGGVQLAALQPSQQMWVFNNSGSGLSVYPPPNGQIDALAVDAAYSLANTKVQIFTCIELLTTGGQFFRSTQLG